MNPVPFAYEGQRDALLDDGGAIRIDRDVVLKVGNPPRFCLCSAREDAEKQREKNYTNRLWDFQLRNSPITQLLNLHPLNP
jgi:hypothetical protein